MSNWTHVTAIVRIDSINHFENYSLTKKYFEKIFGKECLWKSPLEVWEDAEKNPNNYLPLGSEGSLEMSIWENPNKNSMAAYTISIFGDLRDHDSADDIINWFKSKCKSKDLMIRQATITVNNEWNGAKSYTYSNKL